MKFVSIEINKPVEISGAKIVLPASILKVLKDGGFKYSKSTNQYVHGDGLTGVTITGSPGKMYEISWEWSEDGEGSDVSTYKVKGDTKAIEKLEELISNKMSAASFDPEEARGPIRKFVDKVKRKIKGVKSTGHPLGDDLKDLMAQYAELKEAGKGNSKKAKAIGAEIGKIKNSLRKKKEN